MNLAYVLGNKLDKWYWKDTLLWGAPEGLGCGMTILCLTTELWGPAQLAGALLGRWVRAQCWEGMEGKAGDGNYLDLDPHPDLTISFLCNLGQATILVWAWPQFLHLHNEGVRLFLLWDFSDYWPSHHSPDVLSPLHFLHYSSKNNHYTIGGGGCWHLFVISANCWYWSI